MAKLILMVDGVGSQQFEISGESLSIGRSSDNDVHIDDLAVSGEHAVIEKSEDENFPGHNQYRIRDLGSTNSTFVNEIEVKSKNLNNNDMLRIGWSTFKFVDDNQPSLDTTAYILPEQA